MKIGQIGLVDSNYILLFYYCFRSECNSILTLFQELILGLELTWVNWYAILCSFETTFCFFNHWRSISSRVYRKNKWKKCCLWVLGSIATDFRTFLCWVFSYKLWFMFFVWGIGDQILNARIMEDNLEIISNSNASKKTREIAQI